MATRLSCGVAEARCQFDEIMHAFEGGHARNVASMSRHPGVPEVNDKWFLIFSHGKVLPQVWHVDASTNVTSTFCMFTRGLPTDVLPCAVTYDLDAALILTGIPEEHISAAKAFAQKQRGTEVASNIEVIIRDIAPLLSSDWEALKSASQFNGKCVNAGSCISTHGAYPHRAPDSDGDFRLVLLKTSYPDYLWQGGYNKAVQHHRSQACLYWWCFLQALYWLYADRVESFDAEKHWMADHPATADFIVDFLKATHAWDRWEDVEHLDLWARYLAASWKSDENEDWPVWVLEKVRVPLSKKERAALGALVTAGYAAKTTKARAAAEAERAAKRPRAWL